MSRAVGRTVARQMDLAEWATINKAEVRALAALRYSEQTGCVGYVASFCNYFINYRSNKRKAAAEEKREEKLTNQAKEEGITLYELKARMEKEQPGTFPDLPATPPAEDDTPDTVQQYYASQDLLKRMKWKRVTWDKKADYDGFARRVMDNDTMFKSVPAFSFMSLHLAHDARASRSELGTTSIEFEPGCLTKKILQERVTTTTIQHPDAEKPSSATSSGKKRKKLAKLPAYTVDWESGEARLADSISPQEIHQFLMNVAPRLQSVQVRMDQEQTKLTEDVEHCRVRLGIDAVKFNKYDRSVWDDPERKLHPDTYVTPADMREFCDNVMKRAFLLRWYLKGTQVRVVRPGQPYKIDMKEREVHIPANFADYNFLPFHGRYEKLEAIFNFQRTIWWFWFSLGLLFVGDFEMI